MPLDHRERLADKIQLLDARGFWSYLSDFGFTRVTMERPLRLRFQMTAEGRAAFLTAFQTWPTMPDPFRGRLVGREPTLNWNATRECDRCLPFAYR